MGSQDGLALQYAHEQAKMDKGIVLLAIRENLLAIRYASEKLHPDQPILDVLLHRDVPSHRRPTTTDLLSFYAESAFAFQHAPTSWKDSKAIMKAAVRTNGLALQHAHDSLKNDKGIAIDAVRNNPYALYFVHKSQVKDLAILKWCGEIVDLKTVQLHGRSALALSSPCPSLFPLDASL